MVNKRKFLIFLTFAFILSGFAYAETDGSEEAYIVDPYTLYTYDELISDIAALEERYPDLFASCVIGKTVQGRDIPAFIFGKGKREIVIDASMHAREYVSTAFTMYMIERYAEGYVNDAYFWGVSYRNVLNSVRFVVVPMMNPDGVNIAQNGESAISENSPLLSMPITDVEMHGYYSWKANANGVDLNRNWPYLWSEDEDVKEPASANYNGTGPLTEPETIAMYNLLAGTDFYMLCSFHTSGQVIYWIDNSNSLDMFYKFYPTIERISSSIGYPMLMSEDVSDFGGYMCNYARATYGKPCMTVELCPFFCDYPYGSYDYFSDTLNQVYPIGLIMGLEVMNMEHGGYPLDVFVDGELVMFPDQQPVIENDRTLVPVRAVSETCGLEVLWKEEDQSVTVTDGKTKIVLTVDSDIIKINGREEKMDVAPCLRGDRLLLPLRAVLEPFGLTVGWDDANYSVTVFSEEYEKEISEK